MWCRLSGLLLGCRFPGLLLPMWCRLSGLLLGCRLGQNPLRSRSALASGRRLRTGRGPRRLVLRRVPLVRGLVDRRLLSPRVRVRRLSSGLLDCGLLHGRRLTHLLRKLLPRSRL